MPGRADAPLRGVLRTAPDGGFDLRRHTPPPALAALVDVVWIVRWDRHGLPTLHTAADLAAHLGLSVRSLHRLFAEYVGVGPGWVARRFRLQEAAVHATTGAPVDCARLATDLGYCDQAHLVRDFTRTVRRTPDPLRRDGSSLKASTPYDAGLLGHDPERRNNGGIVRRPRSPRSPAARIRHRYP